MVSSVSATFFSHSPAQAKESVREKQARERLRLFLHSHPSSLVKESRVLARKAALEGSKQRRKKRKKYSNTCVDLDQATVPLSGILLRVLL